MLEHQILKALLNKAIYAKYRENARLSDGLKPWVQTLDSWFSTHDTDISCDDLYTLHIARHPVMTKVQKDLVDAAYNILKETEVNLEVIEELLLIKKQQEQYMSWAERLVRLGETRGTPEDFLAIKEEIEKFDALAKTGSEFPPLEITADEMLEASIKQGRWKFNLPVIQEKTGGIGPGVFVLSAGRPNSGKSLFCISSSFAPEGFIEQGAKVVYLGNEEAIHRTKHRAICSWSGMEYKFSKQNPSLFKEKASDFDTKFKDSAIFIHRVGVPYYDIEKLLKEHSPDVLVLDQIDKLYVKGDAPMHEKTRVVYTTIREYSVAYNCAIIGVCQASEAASGKKYFGFDALEHSKTGKAAELDLCICIGKEDLQEDNNVRYFYLPKNKLTGDESSGSFMINKEMSRLEV
jgi:KaiC/GvpD/RAD55 family RecA-like ATPase